LQYIQHIEYAVIIQHVSMLIIDFELSSNFHDHP